MYIEIYAKILHFIKRRRELDVTGDMRRLLGDDIELVRDALDGFAEYDFAADMRERMERAGLSVSALARRAMVSRAAVGKWLNGEARPAGKERMKLVGMALGLNVEELNELLYKNAYSRLYAKNPLDNACALVIRTCPGREDTAQRYAEFIRLYRLRDYAAEPGGVRFTTDQLGKSFDAVDGGEAFAVWIKKHRGDFSASARHVLANERLLRHIWLYVGDSSINDMYVAGELPLPVKNLLYPLLGSREVPLRGLREKLIAFALYENMTEEELDRLLLEAKLRALSEPVTGLDVVVLTAVRTAHERYPYYAYCGAEKLVRRLKADMLLCTDAARMKYLNEELERYEEQLENAALCVRYYDGHKTAEDDEFELMYSDRSGRGLTQYAADVLRLMAGEGRVEPGVADELLSLWGERGCGL